MYERASGQKINLQKSSFSFSSNLSRQAKESLCQKLGIQELEEQGNYLGMPSIIERNKKAVFQFLLNKDAKRLLG